MDGIFNIYKEKGFTSHDVVAIVRRTIHMKKVGHTGTLDPDAEGVLPVCVGKATKLSDVIMDGRDIGTCVLPDVPRHAPLRRDHNDGGRFGRGSGDEGGCV